MKARGRATGVASGVRTGDPHGNHLQPKWSSVPPDHLGHILELMSMLEPQEDRQNALFLCRMPLRTLEPPQCQSPIQNSSSSGLPTTMPINQPALLVYILTVKVHVEGTYRANSKISVRLVSQSGLVLLVKNDLTGPFFRLERPPRESKPTSRI